MRPGPKNLITDVAGLRVGNVEDHAIKTGVTVLTADVPFTSAVHVMGGAPGTRETDLLAPDATVQQVDALVLAGGSAFGLAAADGVADALHRDGRGFVVGPARVPIVPGAILIDLLNGGDKDWVENPYPALGSQAYANTAQDFDLGTAGAGTGATTATLKGGLGSASLITETGHTVGVLAAVNTVGAVTVDDGPHFWAAPFEIDAEFGGKGPAVPADPTSITLKRPARRQNTVIAVAATDAALSQAQAKRFATATHDGMARAVVPSHTPLDGDLVFAAATGTKPLTDPMAEGLILGHAAALCLSRAIARAVFLATPAPGDTKPTWMSRFG